MNRIILIGNGFDLAHGLKTRYEDFINWYWEQRVNGFVGNTTNVSEDCLCTFRMKEECDISCWNVFHFQYCSNKINPIPAKEIVSAIFENSDCIEVDISPLFKSITQSIETKGWVDIENEYYLQLSSLLDSSKYKSPKDLNDEIDYIKSILTIYLNSVQNSFTNNSIDRSGIFRLIYKPFSSKDIALESRDKWHDFLDGRCKWNDKTWYDFVVHYSREVARDKFDDIIKFVADFKEQIKNLGVESIPEYLFPEEFLAPNRIMLLNFNYTTTADDYLMDSKRYIINHIHGELKQPDSVIFGYGDELDENYKKIQNLNDNEYLRNVKSVRYLESDNYRNLLSFVESAPYQIYIMGHSCGNSDRTLLNTLFEHKNCVSIKPFYYKRTDGSDNYLEIVQNISRNFKDMKLMRDRVVNKTFCEPLPQIKST